MVEPKWLTAELNDIMSGREFHSFIVQRCLERRRPELGRFGREFEAGKKIVRLFPRVIMTRQLPSCEKAMRGALENKFEWGGDLARRTKDSRRIR